MLISHGAKIRLLTYQELEETCLEDQKTKKKFNELIKDAARYIKKPMNVTAPETDYWRLAASQGYIIAEHWNKQKLILVSLPIQVVKEL